MHDFSIDVTSRVAGPSLPGHTLGYIASGIPCLIPPQGTAA